MSNSELDSIVSRANQMLAKEPGFLNCSISTRGPPHVLAYQFDNGPNAERFKSGRELTADSTGFQYRIDDQQPSVVLEHRPR